MNKTENAAALSSGALKEILEQIQTGETSWEEENERLLLASMLEHIGSTDSTLRDTCIYGTFCNLVVERRLQADLLKKLLEKCLADDMLFRGIGEVETDTVFTRAFTTLLIALILYSDNETGFLSKKEVEEVKEKLILYLEQEKDLRGFVSEKGWAHSIAHAADAFDELAKNPFADKEMHVELLTALWQKALVAESVYLHDEEERLIVPIVAMLQKGMAPELVKGLLTGLPEEIHKQKEQLAEEHYWFLMANAKKFLKSFYLTIDGDVELVALQKNVRTCLMEL